MVYGNFGSGHVWPQLNRLSLAYLELTGSHLTNFLASRSDILKELRLKHTTIGPIRDGSNCGEPHDGSSEVEHTAATGSGCSLRSMELYILIRCISNELYRVRGAGITFTRPLLGKWKTMSWASGRGHTLYGVEVDLHPVTLAMIQETMLDDDYSLLLSYCTSLSLPHDSGTI